MRGSEGLGPAGLGLLPAARDRKRVGLDRLHDHRARADIAALPDRHRRDESPVGADEGAGADVVLVLGEAVVIADEGSDADEPILSPLDGRSTMSDAAVSAE